MFWSTTHHIKGNIWAQFPFCEMGKGMELGENVTDSVWLHILSI